MVSNATTPSFFFMKRCSNAFGKPLAKLRKKGIVVDWSSTKHFNIIGTDSKSLWNASNDALSTVYLARNDDQE